MGDFFRNRKVLVAGGTGFVGREFVDQLLAQDAVVRVTRHRRSGTWPAGLVEYVDGDLATDEFCLRACADVDAVVHAAGPVGSAGTATGADTLARITENLVLTAKLLHAACRQGVERFLLFSSSSGYPAVRHPVREEEFWDGPPHNSYFGYGWMRRYFERLGEFADRQCRTSVKIVRPTATYGRHDDFHPRSSHVIPALVRRAVAKENPFTVWGGADVVRDFLHVSDLVRGCLLALEKLPDCRPVNIGSGRPITIGELVAATLAAAGHADAEVLYDESKPTTIPFRLADTSQAFEKLGFVPVVDLREGIADTVAWYRQALAGGALKENLV